MKTIAFALLLAMNGLAAAGYDGAAALLKNLDDQQAKELEALLARHKLRDPDKFQQASQLVAANIDVAAIRQGLGL